MAEDRSEQYLKITNPETHAIYVGDKGTSKVVVKNLTPGDYPSGKYKAFFDTVEGTVIGTQASDQVDVPAFTVPEPTTTTTTTAGPTFVLDPTALSLEAGATADFTATPAVTNGGTYVSSDETVATVEYNLGGKYTVTGVKAGTTTITVTNADGESHAVDITITAPTSTTTTSTSTTTTTTTAAPTTTSTTTTEG